MENLSNEILTETILNYHRTDINHYQYGIGSTANFIEYAAEKYKLKYKKTESPKVISLFYKGKEISRMSGLRPSSTKNIAYKLCKNKFRLESYLNLIGLNTLKSGHFNSNEFDKALKYIKNNNPQKFVIKPLNLAGGKGIKLNIDENNFQEAWDECIDTQIETGLSKPTCIIQPFIDGFDIRVTIIEGRYSGALLRLPAHVVGDGNHSVSELIKQKNDLRKTISYFRNKLIPEDENLNEYLSKNNLSTSYIPQDKEVIMLSDISNLTHGGESIDITNILSKDIKDLAINAAAAVPGLYSTGIDIMAKDFKNGEGYIIEMNTSANLTMHHLPLKGNKSFPYYSFVRTSLIKQKVELKEMLTQKEYEIWSEVSRFMQLKDEYFGKALNNLYHDA